jgi:hypothetical protein
MKPVTTSKGTISKTSAFSFFSILIASVILGGVSAFTADATAVQEKMLFPRLWEFPGQGRRMMRLTLRSRFFRAES